MTRTDFIEGYCERSQISWPQLESIGTRCLPCECGGEICPGWRMVFSPLTKVEGEEEQK